MNYIRRDKECLPELASTSEQFKREIAGKNRQEAYEHYENRKSTLKYNTEETKQEFKRMNEERCSFCTQIILEFERDMTVEHIETKKEVPEKIYEWNNLLCACKACNTKRGIKRFEEEKYLNPTKVEDIEKYFVYHADGTISINEELSQQETEAAKYMIDLYGLDRDSLVYERRSFFKDLQEDEFYEGLLKQRMNSRRIILRSVFTYYKRRIRDGK